MKLYPSPSAAVLLVLVFALNRASALGGQPAVPAAPGKEVKGEKARVSAPHVPPADLKELTAGNRAFGLELYQSLRAAPGNLFLSPLGISQAMAMTYAGAGGQTKAEMREARGWLATVFVYTESRLQKRKWWRRRESNPRPDASQPGHLRG